MSEAEPGSLLARKGDEIWIQPGQPVGDGLGLALRIEGSSEDEGKIALLSYSEARRLAVRLMTAAEDGETADREAEQRRASEEREELESIVGVRTVLATPQLVSH